MDLDDEVYIYIIHPKELPSRNYALLEVYKIHDEGTPIVNPLGSWSEVFGLDLVDMNKNSRRCDLNVSTLCHKSTKTHHITCLVSFRDTV